MPSVEDGRGEGETVASPAPLSRFDPAHGD